MIYLICLLTFAAVALLVSYLTQPRVDVVRRRVLEDGSPNALARRRTVEGSAGRRLVRPMAQKFGSAFGKLLPQNMVHSLEVMLVEAGDTMTLSTFLTIWAVCSGGAALLTFWIATTFSRWGALPLTIIGGFLLFYGVILPYVLIRRRARSRKRQIERGLPDSIDLLLTCVEAGMGVDAAFALVAERSEGPLAQALTEYLKQVGLGRTRREALEDIAQRTGAHGLNRLAAIVSQSSAVGTSMGDVLRVQAEELRASRRLRAQEAAARAPIWMTIPLALCFMPAMGAVIVVPSILGLLDSIGEFGLKR